jgi:hypothetical protein
VGKPRPDSITPEQRLLTHRSFKCRPAVEYALAFLGALTLEGGPIDWVTRHIGSSTSALMRTGTRTARARASCGAMSSV